MALVLSVEEGQFRVPGEVWVYDVDVEERIKIHTRYFDDFWFFWRVQSERGMDKWDQLF